MLVINVLMDVLFLLFRVNNIKNGFIVVGLLMRMQEELFQVQKGQEDLDFDAGY